MPNAISHPTVHTFRFDRPLFIFGRRTERQETALGNRRCTQVARVALRSAYTMPFVGIFDKVIRFHLDTETPI